MKGETPGPQQELVNIDYQSGEEVGKSFSDNRFNFNTTLNGCLMKNLGVPFTHPVQEFSKEEFYDYLGLHIDFRESLDNIMDNGKQLDYYETNDISQGYLDVTGSNYFKAGPFDFTGDFTIEMYVERTGGTYLIDFRGSQQVCFYNGNNWINSSVRYVSNLPSEYIHYVIEKYNGIWQTFMNGVSKGSYNWNSGATISLLTFMARYSNSHQLAGKLKHLKVYEGVAKYKGIGRDAGEELR